MPKEEKKSCREFIKYDNDINKKKDIYANLSYCSAVENAFRAVDRTQSFGLRALLGSLSYIARKM